MSHRWNAAAALTAAVFAVSPAIAGGNANFFAGQRSLSEDDIDGVELEALDDHTAFGVSVDWSVGDWPIHLVAGILQSSRDETESFGPLSVDEEVTFTELSFGVRKPWAVAGNARPFVGGGLTRMEGELELDVSGVGSLDEDDDAIAVFLEGGLSWRLGPAFNLGGAVRVVREADMEIEGSDFDGDYVQYGVLLGWGWGD
jgi:hypothetical protein